MTRLLSLFLGFVICTTPIALADTLVINSSRYADLTESTTLSGNFRLGDPKASVSIVMYGDFEDPFSLRFYQDTFPQLLKDYIEPGKVTFVFRHFTMPFHSHALPAAYAAECAGKQHAFFPYHDALFDNQQIWRVLDDPALTFIEMANGLSLDTTAFTACLTSSAIREKVEGENARSTRTLIGTPTFFIRGKKIEGAQPYLNFKRTLDAALTASTRSHR